MPSLSPRDIAQKTETFLSLTDLASAGELNDWQLDSLKPIIQAQAVLLSETNLEYVDQKKGKYETGGFADRISHVVPSTGELDPSDYSKLGTAKVPFDCTAYRAVVKIDDRVARNSLEKGNLGAYCMQQAAPRIALDIEEAALQSELVSPSTDDLEQFNGFIVQGKTSPAVNVHPVSAEDMSDTVLYKMRSALSDSKYWRDPINMLYLMSPLQEGVLAYSRYSQYGDKGYGYVEQNNIRRMTYMGARIIPVPEMPDTTCILTHKDNMYHFLEQDITWELWRYGLGKCYYYIVDYAFDVKYVFAAGVVVHDNLSTPAIVTL